MKHLVILFKGFTNTAKLAPCLYGRAAELLELSNSVIRFPCIHAGSGFNGLGTFTGFVVIANRKAVDVLGHVLGAVRHSVTLARVDEYDLEAVLTRTWLIA